MKVVGTISLVVCLITLVFIPRVFDLDAFRSPDEKRWLANTAGFTRKLAYGELRHLLQQPHPGITIQWLGATTIRYPDWALNKLPLVIGNGLLILLAGYIFGRLWGWPAGILLTLVLSFNPLLYAHTRVYAMDSFLALFALLSLGCLFLWHQTQAPRYLIASAFAAAAALLSKLPGVIIVPFTFLLWLWWSLRPPNRHQLRYSLRSLALWTAIYIIGLGLILPSFALNPTSVIGDFREFFRSDDYQELHQTQGTYYIRSLVFFSSPIHWLTLLALPFILLRLKPHHRAHSIILLGFALLFTIQMALGAKQGDRYILPTFLALDAVAAVVMTYFFSSAWQNWTQAGSRFNHRKLFKTVGALVVSFVLLWQATIIWTSHPHTLAYINPLTRPLFGDRRHGWGEGLDLAAHYLNQKPNAAALKVASYYPNEFSAYFDGETVPAHQHDIDSVDYVVLYRAMLERGAEAWETDVLHTYQEKTPEHIITLNGLEFVWIYRR